MDLQLRHRLPMLAGRLWRNLKQSVAIDTRSLAVFRISVALLVIADILLRSRNFSFYYTDGGVVSQAAAIERTADSAISVYYLTSDPTIIAALFVLQALIALQLLVGYKTRIAVILTFIGVISLDHHNPFVTSYADVLFRLLLFWAIFLPLGERWSIDAVHRKRLTRKQVVSVASAGILLQIVYMYFRNWYHKSGNELWTGGEATPLIMGLDDTTFLLGEFTRNFPTLLQIGGLTWYYMLFFSWLLILLAGRKRILFTFMFIAGHASFAVTVRIGAFAYVAIAGLVLFLQARFWDDLSRGADAIGFNREKLRQLETRLTNAATRVPAYPHTDPRVREFNRIAGTIAGVMLVAALLVIAGALYAPVGSDTIEQSAAVDGIETSAEAVDVDQPTWSVFAPTPRTSDLYYVFEAELDNGTTVDVYNDREFTMDRPHDGQLHRQYDTYRERFYMNSVRRGAQDDRNEQHIRLAEHHCEEWAATHDTEIEQLTMHFVRETVTMETIDDPENRTTRTEVLYEHSCAEQS